MGGLGAALLNRSAHQVQVAPAPPDGVRRADGVKLVTRPGTRRLRSARCTWSVVRGSNALGGVC